MIADIVTPEKLRERLQMTFDSNAPNNAPSQFIVRYPPKHIGIYDITVCAYQKKNGNTGVSRATVILSP